MLNDFLNHVDKYKVASINPDIVSDSPITDVYCLKLCEVDNLISYIKSQKPVSSLKTKRQDLINHILNNKPCPNFFIVRNEKQIIGFAYGYILIRPDGKQDFYLHAIDIMDGFQGKGYGTELMKFIKEYIKKTDACIVGISAGSINSAKIVFNSPEEEKDLTHPAILKGLDLTTINIEPHFDLDNPLMAYCNNNIKLSYSNSIYPFN
mgnify:CR=1 FL=1